MHFREFNPKIKLTRKPTSSYRLKYNDKNLYDFIRINIHYNGNIIQVYEIDTIHLPEVDSIHLKIFPTDNSFQVSWSPKAIEPYLKRIK